MSPFFGSRFDDDVWGHVVGSRRRLREGHVVMGGVVEGGNIWEAATKFRAWLIAPLAVLFWLAVVEHCFGQMGFCTSHDRQIY